MAWFIHRNKQIAYLIGLGVAYRWEIVPPQGQRTLSREQKFQRLVFEISEYFEKFIFQLLYPERFQIVLAEGGLPTSPQPLFWPVFANTERPAGPASPRRTPPLRDREINSAEAFARVGGCRKRGHKKIAVSKSFKHI